MSYVSGMAKRNILASKLLSQFFQRNTNSPNVFEVKTKLYKLRFVRKFVERKIFILSCGTG